MATKPKDEPEPVDEDEEEEEDSESESESESEDNEASESDAEAEVKADGEGSRALVKADSAELATEPEGEPEEEVAAAQLGNDRYVLAAFFAVGLLSAYVIGKTLHGFWASISNKDWFTQSLPQLAAVGEEDKQTYAFVLAGIVSLVGVLRTYRRPDVRAWADEVAGELAKCRWPTKKEVYSATFVVIVASAAATVYLALLDRLWAFVTNLVYGDGS